MLGVPLGSAAYEEGFLVSALKEDRRGLDRLQLLGDPQVALRILTQVFAQRPSYLLRCCPPSPAFLVYLGDYDRSLWETLCGMLGVSLSWVVTSFAKPRERLGFRYLMGVCGCLVREIYLPLHIWGPLRLPRLHLNQLSSSTASLSVS